MVGTTGRSQSSRMVPLDDEYGFVRREKIAATVTWWEQPGQRGVRPLIYAPTTRFANLVPSGGNLGNQIKDLIDSGQLVPFDAVARRHFGLYLIHDNRPGQGRSYMIWTGRSVQGVGPTLYPQTVYYCMEPSDAPVLTEYGDVLGLMRTRGAKLINSFEGVDMSKSWTEAFGDGVVLVVDLQKVHQNS